jgi:hypothetical protein
VLHGAGSVNVKACGVAVDTAVACRRCFSRRHDTPALPPKNAAGGFDINHRCINSSVHRSARLARAPRRCLMAWPFFLGRRGNRTDEQKRFLIWMLSKPIYGGDYYVGWRGCTWDARIKSCDQ